MESAKNYAEHQGKLSMSDELKDKLANNTSSHASDFFIGLMEDGEFKLFEEAQEFFSQIILIITGDSNCKIPKRNRKTPAWHIRTRKLPTWKIQTVRRFFRTLQIVSQKRILAIHRRQSVPQAEQDKSPPV
jgi:hypothetical protein